jgi:hypothetical protein
VQHGGAWQGFTSHISRFMDNGLTVIVLANRSRARPQLIAAKIASHYIPGLMPAAPTAKTLASIPMFLRGSMNEWGLRDQMQNLDHGIYESKIELKAGAHMFKVASEDWFTIDFGAAFDEQSTDLDKAKPLEFKGENLIVEAPQLATYVFRLDVREPGNPILILRRETGMIE